MVDGQIKELRPNEEIILKTKIDHPYLQLLVPKAVDTVSNPSKTKVKSNATRNRSV